jgi:hypothetical protein
LKAYSGKKVIGSFDGKTVKDQSGNVIYWLSDEDVFAPTGYENSSSLQVTNRHPSTKVGEFASMKCTSGSGEIIFEVK